MVRFVELAISGTIDVDIAATIIVDTDDEDIARDMAIEAWQNGEFSRFQIEDVEYANVTSVDTDYLEVVGNDHSEREG